MLSRFSTTAFAGLRIPSLTQTTSLLSAPSVPSSMSSMWAISHMFSSAAGANKAKTPEQAAKLKAKSLQEKEKLKQQKEKERAKKVALREKEMQAKKAAKEKLKLQKEKEKLKEREDKEKAKKAEVKAAKAERPKRPLTPFLVYVREKFATAAEKSTTEKIASLATSFKALSPLERQHLESVAATDKARYKEQMEKYNAKKEEEKKDRPERRNPFSKFVKSTYQKGDPALLSLPFKERSQRISSLWKSLSEQQKKAYDS
eukprot:gnl/Spiro4/1951_TR924_c0_g1_i1.p1 gnl/Spiro4/1951_TR924_c0_g1~~gnl/Spiro4/1951_TR924_c0_g1_i1.p1  ORF type:complete len:259 (+),score=74.66 gnl/Spiro4/1951_TR924_c0_g1_i1:50-826(+)